MNRFDAPDLDVAALYRRDWRVAGQALRKLLVNADDTPQVFTIMRALNGASTPNGYRRLLDTQGAGRIAYHHPELAERLSDRAWVDGFAPGTVGAAYRAFVDKTGYSAQGLADTSSWDREGKVEHPYAWFGRRTRDVHDIWHILTGYHADEALGEACLVAFSFAQTRGLGWAAIATGAALKSLAQAGTTLFARAVWEGWQRGRAARWLLAEDYEALLTEPLDAARKRLRLSEPAIYPRARAAMGDELETFGRPEMAGAR
jgi:ubiquinone biosynthesis protein COQ4